MKNLTQPETLTELKETLPKMLDDYVMKICPEEADGQVKRVAQRFALVDIAGDLAIQHGILPAEIASMNAVKACFDSWLEACGGTESAEKIAILERIRLCLEKHGAEQFQPFPPPEDSEGEEPFTPFIRNRLGFKDDNGFYILPESFKQIMQGYNPKQAVKILYEAKWIFSLEKGRYTKRRTLSELGQQYVYCIRIPQAKE